MLQLVDAHRSRRSIKKKPYILPVSRIFTCKFAKTPINLKTIEKNTAYSPAIGVDWFDVLSIYTKPKRS
jgi:hypothetical protein